MYIYKHYLSLVYKINNRRTRLTLYSVKGLGKFRPGFAYYVKLCHC